MREAGFSPSEIESSPRIGEKMLNEERSFMDRFRGKARILGFALMSLSIGAEACAASSTFSRPETGGIVRQVESEEHEEERSFADQFREEQRRRDGEVREEMRRNTEETRRITDAIRGEEQHIVGEDRDETNRIMGRILTEQEAPITGQFDIAVESDNVLRVLREQGLRIGTNGFNDGLINERGEMTSVFFRAGEDLPPLSVSIASEGTGRELRLLVTIEHADSTSSMIKIRNGAPESVTEVGR